MKESQKMEIRFERLLKSMERERYKQLKEEFKKENDIVKPMKLSQTTSRNLRRLFSTQSSLRTLHRIQIKKHFPNVLKTTHPKTKRLICSPLNSKSKQILQKGFYGTRVINSIYSKSKCSLYSPRKW
jgi:hypothetical protein